MIVSPLAESRAKGLRFVYLTLPFPGVLRMYIKTKEMQAELMRICVNRKELTDGCGWARQQ
jgi:hypothetical protein